MVRRDCAIAMESWVNAATPNKVTTAPSSSRSASNEPSECALERAAWAVLMVWVVLGQTSARELPTS